jgi:putative ABC transport system substrate-binding protein
MKRREFIGLSGATAAAWPLVALAQPSERVRRIGVLGPLASDDPVERARMAAFRQGLQPLGWSDGRNLLIEYRSSVGGAEELRRFAEEVVSLKPDAILVTGSAPLAALRLATDAVPIVFVNVADPVGAGFVQSLAHPGGNVTGFTPVEYAMSGKCPELLKEVQPTLKRVAVLREAGNPGSMGQFAVIEATTRVFGVELVPVDAVYAGTIERTIAEFAREPHGGVGLPAHARWLGRELVGLEGTEHVIA